MDGPRCLSNRVSNSKVYFVSHLTNKIRMNNKNITGIFKNVYLNVSNNM